ncbi:hypothetical protein MKW94_010006 [Papaver nudicaule]|uniref:Biogenesis of lysosome-related organelles complex 1 subunit 1 n=1 Tax=Papaver nudicaule TaxID=74823 RepID=A0AA41RXG1_PAPNU|nr:hypothetical protein [Papaver nudicaule]MCL7046651.1 hypothetical protein [Papaver nudicaule]MCL7050845.1 hypothetical protein [Papaver nudicaule]
MEKEKLIKSSEIIGGSGLESSLIQLIQDHNLTTIKTREQTDKAKKNALKSAIRVSDLLVDTVNGGVQETFVNQKRIEHEIRALTATTIKFTKQTDQWLTASHAINSALKEIGDFENWMKTMDYDCKIINAAIRNIYKP